MIKKMILVALSSLAVTAYMKRHEIAYAAIGAAASAEEKIRRALSDVSRRYLAP